MATPKESELTYEAALEKLEIIVSQMEEGDVPLADLLTQFEQGTQLLHHCESHLKTAELRIEQLKRNKDGSDSFEPFQTTETED